MREKLITDLSIGLDKIKYIIALIVYSCPIIFKFFGLYHSNYSMMQYLIFLYILLGFIAVNLFDKMHVAMDEINLDVWFLCLCLAPILFSFKMGKIDLFSVMTNSHGNQGLRAAGMWLRDNVENPEGIDIAAPKKGEIVLFYSNGKSVSMGDSVDIGQINTRSEIIKVLEYYDLDYLINYERHSGKNPILRKLSEEPTFGADLGLRVIHYDKENNLQIFEVISE